MTRKGLRAQHSLDDTHLFRHHNPLAGLTYDVSRPGKHTKSRSFQRRYLGGKDESHEAKQHRPSQGASHKRTQTLDGRCNARLPVSTHEGERRDGKAAMEGFRNLESGALLSTDQDVTAVVTASV